MNFVKAIRPEFIYRAFHVEEFIKADTTPEKFDTECQKFRNYTIDSEGGRCNCTALI